MVCVKAGCLVTSNVAKVATGVSDRLPGPRPHTNTHAKMNKIPCQIGVGESRRLGPGQPEFYLIYLKFGREQISCESC